MINAAKVPSSLTRRGLWNNPGTHDMKSIFLVFALGLAGIDPLGLAILLGAISAGGGKAQVIAFSLATFVGTVVLGALASIFGSQLADMIRPFIPGVNDPAWAVVELLVATLTSCHCISCE